MNGVIARICMNDWGNRTFGFISGEDGQDYFFIKTPSPTAL